MKALEFLQDKEWSMGNGQCPECCGVPESWHGHLLYPTSENIGHKADCILAAAIKDVDGTPVMIGDYQSDVEYEAIWTKGGIMSMKNKLTPLQSGERIVQSDYDKSFKKAWDSVWEEQGDG